MFRTVIILMLFFISFVGRTQEEETLSYAEQLAALESEMDSLSIFNLIESVIALEIQPSSELNVHFGFTSSVTSAGRDYDVNQQGLSPGLSYYHKSGVYSDISGYWNSDIEPRYNPTVFSFGYLNTNNAKWTYSLDYERWFFNPQDTSDNPLTNSLGGSITRDFKAFNVGLDYSFLFGNETAHRMIGTVGHTISLGKWGFFNNVSLYPSGNILFGNGNITLLRITRQQLSDIERNTYERLISFNTLTDRERERMETRIERAFENGRITENRRNTLLGLIQSAQELTTEEIQEIQALINEGIELESYEDGNAFGLMNYSFTLPLALTVKNFSVILSYTYSVPVALPGEFFEVDPVGFFGASVSYRIPFK